ncbi:neurogenic differentiation factor 1-like [Montipora capricornis]|uniref:neurogenic differentiation factor 1-like n=1 Tax=Montipora capricornis TaxID=246305 RepID=UPI0035F11EAB
MECPANNRSKKPRKRNMSREKRILANQHERERVRKMNDAYEELRRAIPNYEETRMKTKLELLLIATNYIKTLKDHLKSVLQNGYNSPANALMYPSAFELENGAARAVSSGITEFPCPPQYPAKPPPLSHLPLCHFAPNQTISGGSQNPVTLTSGTDSLSSQELSSLFASCLTDLYTDENFLYTLQNAASSLYNEEHNS